MKNKFGKYLVYSLGISLVLIFIFGIFIPEFMILPGIYFAIVFYVMVGYLIKHFIDTKDDRKRKRSEKRAMHVERKLRAQERRARDNHPIDAKFLFVEDKLGTSLSGGLALMAIGGMIGGSFGAAYGAHKASNMKTGNIATFSVKYESGRIGTEAVDVSSNRFQELIKLTM